MLFAGREPTPITIRADKIPNRKFRRDDERSSIELHVTIGTKTQDILWNVGAIVRSAKWFDVTRFGVEATIKSNLLIPNLTREVVDHLYVMRNLGVADNTGSCSSAWRTLAG